jgi:NAD+ synthase
MKIRALQLNAIVGDIQGNYQKLLIECHKAIQQGIDIVITPECFLSGYPPEDLIFSPIFQETITVHITYLADALKLSNLVVILGTPRFDNKKIYNAAFWIHQGAIQHICDKHYLPNFGTFDDMRLFSIGQISHVIHYQNIHFGIMICEDMWHQEPALFLKEKNADILIVLNASPFEIDKHEKRLTVAKNCVALTKLPLMTCFIIGGQDELVFDGRSFALNAQGNKIIEAQGFVEDFYDVIYENHNLLPVFNDNYYKNLAQDFSENALIYNTVILGLRDYIVKNNFKGIVLGLSGGVDSVLSAVIAVDAIGVDKVHCLLLPSQYTSQNSFDDAYAVIDALGISYDVIAIQEAVNSVENIMHPIFHEYPSDITEENMQSRMRGLILMAYSNKIGHMVLTTGNKSEMAVGYATLYGDMCGGYNCLKDIYKTKIYELCHYRNDTIPDIGLLQKKNLIPNNVITKAPTAELKDNQKDSDSLPDYPTLDAILYAMIEQQLSVKQIIELGYNPDIVRKIRKLIDAAEYKRRQSAIGTKITSKNFGRDRRYPVTHKFKF